MYIRICARIFRSPVYQAGRISHLWVPLWLNSTEFHFAWEFHPAGSSTPGEFHSSRNSNALVHSSPSFTLPGSSTLLGVPPPGSSTPLGIPPLWEFHSSGVSLFWEFDLLGILL